MRKGMRGIILLLMSVVITPLSAQNSKEHRLEWSKTRYVQPAEGSRRLIFTFEGASYQSPYPDIPQYCHSRPYSGAEMPRVLLSNFQFSPVNALEKTLLAGLSLSAEPQVKPVLGRGRSGNRLSWCIYPFVKRNGQILKLTTFSSQVIEGDGLPTGIAKAPQRKTVANSKLSTGDWYKIAVGATNMYKITPAWLEESEIGSDVPIGDLRIIGNSSAMLPENLVTARPDDLLEVPLHVVDQNQNGLFDGSDYALFYGASPHEWRYDASNGRYSHRLNIYREKNYYFLSVNSGAGARLSPQAGPTNPTETITAFDGRAYFEEDKINLVGTGREWFGDAFEFTLSYNYDFSFPDIITSEPVELQVSLVGRVSSSNTSISTNYLGQPVLNNPITQYPTAGNYPDFATRSTRNTTFTAQGPNITLNLNYDNNSNPSGVAWLDRIRLQARRNLIYRNRALRFRDSRSLGPGKVGTFVVANAPTDLQIWRVTDPASIEAVQWNAVNGNAEFNAALDELEEYVAFSGGNFDSPELIGPVENQNLHGMAVPEMIVIAHPSFRSAAEDLAEFHTENDNLTSTVVSTSEVYNEYGSGGQDIVAIRDFVKDLYDQGSNLKYVLLFGDASYDYKDRLNDNNNFVPTWQSGFSFSLGGSFITDDFYAYMDPGEATSFAGAIMDLGVGRITCSTLSQANAYVGKVKHYTTGAASFGEWRNRILLMADDVDLSWERAYFIPKSENLDRLTAQASKSFNVEKIYTDAYQQQTTTGSQTYPEASRDMFRKIQQGCLVTNYVGHGGEIGLASEKLLQLSDINNWTNYDALSLFVTITCEFTRFDDPKRVSAGEQLLTKSDGGAIALLSTTRVVQVQPAVDLNEAVFDTILARPGGQPQTLGDIIRAAKNDPFVVGRGTKTKFSLIGDPALRLAIPYQRVRTTAINGVDPASGSTDTLKALSKVSIEGQVEDLNGNRLDQFDGELKVSIFDKPSERETLVNDGVGAPQKFEVQNNLLYRGKVAVEQGRFTVEFRVPLDIAYRFDFGKFSYYASDLEEGIDAAGYFDTVVIGGFSEDAPEDEQGPQIELFMNDRQFVRGGITGSDPFLLAVLRDSSGINTVGNGIGHDLKAVLDNRSDQPLVLNEFYEADLNSYQSGEVRYQLFDLEEGSHTLNLQAFDIYNNPSQASTEFIVAQDEELVLRQVLNYPNPFTTHTEFQFEHNRADQALEVQVQIFTVDGKLVKTINAPIQSTGNRVTGIAWNGLDDYGDKIGKGVYVYRVKVRSISDNTTADAYEKLVILR